MQVLARALCAVVALAIAACSSEPPPPAPAPVAEPAAQQAPPPEEAPATHEEQVRAIVEQVPQTHLELGTFPYFSMPDTFRLSQEDVVELAHAPFWVADGYHWIEGRVYQTAIFPAQGQPFSELALREHVDFMITAAGGVRIERVERIPSHVAAAAGLTDVDRNRLREGLGHFYSRPVSTYLIKRPTREVWVHFTSFDSGGSLLMAETSEFVPEARLLSGLDLRDRLISDGSVNVEINFESGQAVVLAQSIPQIDQIAELLRLDPVLSLSVNGHTDDQGSAERNLELSTRRAEVVARLLVQRGIDEGRLRTHGFGQARPVADNDSAQGRAQNRRVELVALD